MEEKQPLKTISERLIDVERAVQALSEQLLARSQLPRADDKTFAEYLEVYYATKTVSKRRTQLYRSAANYVLPVLGKVKMSELDTSHCLQLLQRLRNAPLQSSTADCYWRIFVNMVNVALQQGYLSASPLTALDSSNKIKVETRERNYLTKEELKRVIDAYDSRKITERAFLFSCFCGLRCCDVFRLRWCDIHHNSPTESYIALVQQKTQQVIYLPLSSQCQRFIPKKPPKARPVDTVFPHKDPAQISRELRRLMKRASVEKRITFHCARHTFATLLLTNGTDLYTISKLLGHTNIKTTQIYAQIIDKKKIDAVNSLNFF